MDQDDTAAAIAVSAETAPEKSTAPAIRSFSRKNFKLNVLGSKVYSSAPDFDSKEAEPERAENTDRHETPSTIPNDVEAGKENSDALVPLQNEYI